MTSRRSARSLAVPLLFLSLLCASSARAYTPVPEFPKDGTVSVRDVPDTFDVLRQFVRSYQSAVGAKYYVAVVAYSDAQDRDGPDYGDENFAYINRVVDEWRQKADSQKGVIVLLALRNRDIIVHPFSAWTALGWEQQAVVDTIDASDFKMFARAGDYDRAVAALIQDIDAELARRVEAAEQRKAKAASLIAVTADLNAAFENVVKRESYDPPAARALHDQALRQLEEAQRAQASGKSGAYELAVAAHESATDAERLVGELKLKAGKAHKRIETLSADLEALRATAASESLASSGIERGTANTTAELAAAEAALRNLDPELALERLTEAQHALSLAAAAIESARTTRTFVTRVVPMIAGSLALLVFAFWFVRQRGRSARRRLEAEGLIAQWQQMMTQAAENLLKLQDEHALILGRSDLVARYVGASTEPVQSAARAVDDLFLSYEAAQRRMTEVDRVVDGAGLFASLREEPWERVVDLLSLEDIVVRNEDLTDRQLFLPDQREVRVKPPALLAQMQATFSRALAEVSELEAKFKRAWEDLERLKSELGTLDALQDQLLALGQPAALAPQVEQLTREATQILRDGQTDPLGGQAAATKISVTLSTLVARTERLLDAVTRVTSKVAPRTELALRLVQTARAEGLRLAEPGFEPDAMLAYAGRHANEALRQVREGNDTEAVKLAKEAEDTIEELIELCERTRQSRSGSEGRIFTLQSRLDAQKQRLPERRSRLGALQASHADAALQPALDNADEAQVVLHEAERCLSEARACVAYDVQRYLAGAELIDRADRMAASVDALYEEIEVKAGELAAARSRAEKDLAEAERAFSDLEVLLDGSDMFASAQTVDARAKLSVQLAPCRVAMGVERPDWLARRDEAAALASLATTSLERARAEKSAYAEAQGLQRELVTRKLAFADLLHSRTDDRVATNDMFRAAAADLEEAQRLAAQKRPSWPEILAALKRSADGLETVKRMAEADFAEAASARKAVASAEEAVTSASSEYYGHGVSASLDETRKAVERARKLLAEQKYAEAARAAEEARQAARRAQGDARFRADLAAEKDRQRRSYRYESSESSSSGWSSSSSFGSSRSSSSFGSSSSRSSFGSSSGSSSFGSSAGRSSFGSSAGRSKW